MRCRTVIRFALVWLVVDPRLVDALSASVADLWLALRWANE